MSASTLDNGETKTENQDLPWEAIIPVQKTFFFCSSIYIYIEDPFCFLFFYMYLYRRTKKENIPVA